MVSHCLWAAAGDVAVVQLVHATVEHTVLPILQQYQRDKQLAVVSRNATQIYAALEERFTGRSVVDESEQGEEDLDDCGFSNAIGSLAEADAAMEEVAVLIQHSESYLRFMQHTIDQVRGARLLRQKSIESERNGKRELNHIQPTTTTMTNC
jgi:conserved oligomeric Golgi complex subunit 4